MALVDTEVMKTEKFPKSWKKTFCESTMVKVKVKVCLALSQVRVYRGFYVVKLFFKIFGRVVQVVNLFSKLVG